MYNFRHIVIRVLALIRHSKNNSAYYYTNPEYREEQFKRLVFAYKCKCDEQSNVIDITHISFKDIVFMTIEKLVG
jgi:hypothetical protein